MFDGNFLQTEADAQAASAQRDVRLEQINEQIEKYFFNLDLGVAMGGHSAGLKKAERSEILGMEFLSEGGELPITLTKRASTNRNYSGNQLQKIEAQRSLDKALRKAPSLGIADAMRSCYEDFADLADEDTDRQIQQSISALDVACYLDLLSGLYARSVETVRPRFAPVGAVAR